MSNLSVGDKVLVTVVGSVCGQRTLNTFLYRVSALTGTPDQATALTAFHSSLLGAGQLIPKFLAAVPTNWFHSYMWYQVILPGRFRKLIVPMSGHGTFGSVANTGNVQGSITRAGELATRAYIGGVRICIGTDSDATDNGQLTVGQFTALNDLASAMKLNVITSGTVATYIPQVGVPRSGSVTHDLYDAFPQYTTRVIRRRTVGVGK